MMVWSRHANKSSFVPQGLKGLKLNPEVIIIIRSGLKWTPISVYRLPRVKNRRNLTPKQEMQKAEQALRSVCNL